MSARVCGRCRRPLPAPVSEGAAPAPCPFCAAQDGARPAAASGARAPQARPPADPAVGKKRSEAFASALVETATRTTPVHSFAVPPEAIPVVNQPRRREPPPPPTPPPVVVAPPPAPEIVVVPAQAPAPAPAPPAPPPRRAAAVTATLASLGPGPFTPQTRAPAAAAPAPVAAAPAAVAAPAVAVAPAVVAAPAAVAVVAPSPAPAAAVAAPVAVAPARVVAPPPAAAVAAPVSAAPARIVAPSSPVASVPAAAPAAAAPAPAPKAAASAASLAATMLALSPPVPESRVDYDAQPDGPTAEVVFEAPPVAAPRAERGADAWNISAYLDPAAAPASTSPPPPAPAPAFTAPGVVAIPQPTNGSEEPLDLQVRGGLASLLHRLQGRGRGIAFAAGAALLVVAVAVGAFVVIGGPVHSGASKPAPTKAAVPALAAPRVAAAPAPAAPLPALVVAKVAEPKVAEPKVAEPKVAEPKVEKSEKVEKIAQAREPEPEAAPPPVEEPAPIAVAPTRSHAHSAGKSKSLSKPSKPVSRHLAHHASSSSGRGNRRTIAHASAPKHVDDSGDDESTRIARARDAYREGNEKLFSGNAAGAITAYEEMVRLNPKDPAGYRGLGLASAQLGKRTEAVRYLRAYLKHAPNADDRAIIISRISLLQTLPPQ